MHRENRQSAVLWGTCTTCCAALSVAGFAGAVVCRRKSSLCCLVLFSQSFLWGQDPTRWQQLEVQDPGPCRRQGGHALCLQSSMLLVTDCIHAGAFCAYLSDASLKKQPKPSLSVFLFMPLGWMSDIIKKLWANRSYTNYFVTPNTNVTVLNNSSPSLHFYIKKMMLK